MVSLPHAAGSIAPARHRMVAELRAHGLAGDLIEDAQTVLGELAANAVEHGRALDGATFEVAWCVVAGTLRISVLDGGDVPELKPATFDLESMRGRGLRIVDTVCDRWTADLVEGTRVTAELRI